MAMVDQIERDLLRGSLDLMVLSVLAQGPQYGYLLQKALDESSQGRVRLAAGTMYPLLHRLEDAGWIDSTWDDSTGRRRKWYRLTPKGQKRLIRQAQLWQQYALCIQRLLEKIELPPTPALECG